MFYGSKIKPGHSAQPKAEDGGEILHLSQICLNDPTDNNKTYVQLQNGSDTFTICTLEKGKNECSTVDLFINTSKNIKISTRGGKNEVHIVGYFEPSQEDEEDDDDEIDDSEFLKLQDKSKKRIK